MTEAMVHNDLTLDKIEEWLHLIREEIKVE